MRLHLCRITLTTATMLVAVSPTLGRTIVDFQFDEAVGTALVDDPADGATPVVSDSISGQTWTPRDSGDEVDLQKVQTDGAGLLSAAGYDTTSTRDASLELAAADQVTATQNSIVRMSVELAPWSFGPHVDGEDEEVRVGFGNTSATNTLGIIIFERLGPDEVTVRADAAGDGVDGVAVDLFDDVQTDPVTLILEIDKLADTYSVFTQVGAGPITGVPMNTGLAVDSERIGAFLRFAFDGPFTGDSFAINSYSVEVIPEPSGLAIVMAVAAGAGVIRRRVA